MSNRRQTWFYGLLIAVTSATAALVFASRLGLAPSSAAQTTAAPPMNSAPLNGPLTSSTFREVAKAVMPAVVTIWTESRTRTRDLDLFGPDDLFDFFGQQPRNRDQRQREQLVQGAGSGFIIDKSGFILTNNHVVEGADTIKVSLYGEEEDQGYDAKVIGRDPLTDSALVELTQMPNHPLPEVKFGDSSQMQPGDWVMAIGNPFGRLAHTVTVGVISGLERPFTVANQRSVQMLQTDAAINQGNSGGPLLNLRGEVIGINAAIYTDAMRQGNIGIGFAIPSNAVRELLPQLRTGKITRGRIGVEVMAVPRPGEGLEDLGLKNRNGALVRSVSPSSPASKAGVEPGDVILAFNGQPVASRDELVKVVVNTKPGSTVPIRIVRDKQERTVNITVEELDLEAEGNPARGSSAPDAKPDQETSSGFGITLQNVTPDLARQLQLQGKRGAVITDVEPGSPADRAGLNSGDLIVRVGRQTVTSAAEARDELARVTSGRTVFLRVVRGGQETFVTLTKR